jgi:hypothetical protein
MDKTLIAQNIVEFIKQEFEDREVLRRFLSFLLLKSPPDLLHALQGYQDIDDVNLHLNLIVFAIIEKDVSPWDMLYTALAEHIDVKYNEPSASNVLDEKWLVLEGLFKELIADPSTPSDVRQRYRALREKRDLDKAIDGLEDGIFESTSPEIEIKPPVRPVKPITRPSPGASRDDSISVDDESIDILDDWLSEDRGSAPSHPGTVRPITPSIPASATQFLAYFPPQAPVNHKSGLYVYAFTGETKDQIEHDIQRYVDQLGGTVPPARPANQTAQLAIGTRIKVVPECDDLELEPQSLTKTWRGDWTRFEFEFVPTDDLVDKILFIRVSIRIEEIEIAHIKCAVEVIAKESSDPEITASDISPLNSAPVSNPLAVAKFKMQSTTPYQRIFISYSRRDTRVTRAYKMVQTALGHDVFLDVDNLRAGENWRAALAKAIDRADIFQLFWSEHSASSEYCKYEWDYALTYRAKDNSEGFVRPVYWRKPMPSPPQELADLNFTYCEFEKQNPFTALLKAGVERISSLYRRVTGQK